MKIYLSVPFVLALCLVALGGCGGSDDSTGASESTPVADSNCKPAHPGVQTLSDGKLSVYVYVSPPYTIEEDGEFSGIDSDIVAELAKMECLELEQNAVGAPTLIAGVQAGRADLGDGGIYYSPERAETLGLTTTLYRDGVGLLASEEISGEIADLEGKTIGVIQGTAWEKDFQEMFGGDVKIYQSTDGMITDLQNGRLDVAVLNSGEAGYRAKQVSGLYAVEAMPDPAIAASEEKNKVVLAVTKKDAGLLEALNADIKELVRNGDVAAALKAYGIDPKLAGGGSAG